MKNKQKNKMLINKKVFIILISIILLMLLVVLGLYLGNSQIRLWMNKYILGKDIGEENLPSIEIEESDNISVYAYSNYIVTVGNGKLTIYNGSANVVNTIDVVINSPIFYSNSNYLLVGDKGSKDLYLLYNDTLEWHKEMEGDISQITVNKNGAACVVLTGTTYKSIIVMYNVNGNEDFKTYLSTTLATDVALSDDNKYLSFIEINTSGAVIESVVKTISIEKAKAEPRNSIIYTYTTNSDTLALNIKYKNNKIVTYCDNGIHVFSEGNDEEVLNIDKNIIFADIELDGNFCIVKEATSSTLLNTEYELKLTNIENKKEHTYLVKSAIKNLYCKNNTVAINLGNEVEFINMSGWLVKKFTSIQNIRDIKLGDNIAAIIYKSKIEVISF